MLRTGEEYLKSLRDGRVVYVGKERIGDVTEHPAFAEAARMYAAMYDMKADPARRDELTFEEDGGRHSLYFLKPKTREDLEKRTTMHRAIAAFSHGLLGRSPDHVASSVTGLSMRPEVFNAGERGAQFEKNITDYQRYARDRDLYLAYAILPPQGARNPDLYLTADKSPPTLRVTAEDDEGVTLNGMKMLATGAVYADEIWIGNIIPLAPSQVKESVTCAVPTNAEGLALWSRPPYAANVRYEFDSPLSYRFDETDSMVVFKDVKVPSDRIFVHDDPALSRNIYALTPAHYMSNHQSNVRFHAKLRLLMGIASLITKSNGAHDIPAVREVLGELASMEAAYEGIVEGQLQGLKEMDNGYVHINPRFMYAGINFAVRHHSEICDQIKTLIGGGGLQMPASIDVVENDDLRPVFEEYWSTLDESAVERMKLFRLAWDLLNSEFAGRHDQYEKFYVGQRFIVRNYNFINTPWDELEGLANGIMDGYEAPGPDS